MHTDLNTGTPSRQELSRTFLEYALPLLKFAGPSVTKTELQQLLQLALLAWNAVLDDKLNGRNDAVAEMTGLAPGRPRRRLKNLLTMLITRKQTDFAKEERFIRQFKVIRKRGRWRLLVDATSAPAGKI